MSCWIEQYWLSHRPVEFNYSLRRGSELEAFPHADAIVLHYTAGGHFLRSTWTWFNMEESRASAHFIIGRGGEIVQCVDLEHKAWHAGISEMMHKGEMTSDVGEFSIGIEMANFGLLHKSGDEYYLGRGRYVKRYKREQYGEPVPATLVYDSGYAIEGYWEPYSERQMGACVTLCAYLSDLLKIPIDRIVGHEDIAIPQGRKSDPGPLWDWNEFHAKMGAQDGADKNRRTHPA